MSKERAHTPITSEKERRLMAMAKHNPSKIYKWNRSILGMSKEQLTQHLHEVEGKKLPMKARRK